MWNPAIIQVVLRDRLLPCLTTFTLVVACFSLGYTISSFIPLAPQPLIDSLYTMDDL